MTATSQRTGGIVLAAGGARRFGSTKQLLAWGKTTLVAHVASIALDAGLDPVLAVTGYEATGVTAALSGLNVEVVFNPDWASGQASSLRRAIAALPQDVQSAIFLLADQPFLTPSVIRELIRTRVITKAPIVIPTYRNRRGNPVLFHRQLFGEILALSGDTGGRSLFLKHRREIAFVSVDNPGVVHDIDTPQAYRAAVRFGMRGH